MCILIIQEYTDCSHYSTTRQKCPAFHKLQGSAGGLIGALFGCAGPRRKDCGRLAHHHALSMPSLCDKCVARRNEGSRGGRPQEAADTEEDRRRRRGDRTKPAHDDPRRQQQQQRHHHAEKTREKFVQTEAYKRSPARALPAGSLSSSSKASGSGRSSHSAAAHQKQQQKSSSSQKHRQPREGRAKKPDDEPPPPVPPVPILKKPSHPAQPAPTYQHRGRFPVAAAAATATGKGAARSKAPAEAAEITRPSASAPRPSEPHELRRKPAKMYLNVRNQPLRPIPAPLPEYQVYLNAMPSVEEAQAARRSQDSSKSQATTASASSNGSSKKTTTTTTTTAAASNRGSAGSQKSTSSRDSGKDLRKRSALASLGRAVGLEPPQHSPFSDDASDLSFVCSDSRKLAETGQIA